MRNEAHSGLPRSGARPTREEPGIFERLYWTAFVLAFGFICFLGGFTTSVLKVFPFAFLRNSVAALDALANRPETVYETDRYVRVTSSSRTGVCRYNPERAFSGYTVFTSGKETAAYLIDMRGDLLHEWRLPYQQVWSPGSRIGDPKPPQGVYWRTVKLFPNGDLLAVYEATNTCPYGYGLVKLDRESRPIWSYGDHAHHCVTVGANGTIYTLTHQVRQGPVPGLPDLPSPSLEDSIVELSPDGNLLKKVSLYDALARSRYRAIEKFFKLQTGGDTLHANRVTPLPPIFHKAFPEAGPDSVLASSRNLDALMVVDMDAAEVVWLQRGPWLRQHDPEPLPNGNILLFDNEGDLKRGGLSRALEIVPRPLSIVWQFPGDSGESLNSTIRSSVQKLPNGNVLITESDGARLLEVTPDRKVVWEYRNPFREGDHGQYVGVLEGAHRFAPDELAFTFNRTTKLANVNSNRRQINVR